MKTRLITYIILAIMFFGNSVFSQEEGGIFDEISEMHTYVINPDSKDLQCILEVNRAKEDISKGIIIFSHQLLFGRLRYEEELILLCKEQGLHYQVDILNDVIIEGQTDGCYGYYMDNIIKEKFGKYFKIKLHQTADSLFLTNVIHERKVVKYFHCDEKPRLPHEKERTNDYIPSIVISHPHIKENKGKFGGWPFFDMGFIVEQDSSISNFFINQFVAQMNRNEKYKCELFEKAVKHIKERYPFWVPGKVLGIPVRTENNVRIHFEME